jgi:hypothetical protein
MVGQVRMRELKCAARQLGVTSTTLRQQGWRTASPARVRAVRDNPPDWLAAGRERRQGKRQRRDRVSTAARLGVQPRAVRERGVKPGEVGGLLAARPGWLIAEQERRQAQTVREADGKLRRELADALVTSVHEVWFQKLKHTVTGADADAVDARWRLRSGGRGRKHGSWSASRCGRGPAGNGTPPTRRPATGPASSCGGHWRGDGA